MTWYAEQENARSEGHQNKKFKSIKCRKDQMVHSAKKRNAEKSTAKRSRHIAKKNAEKIKGSLKDGRENQRYAEKGEMQKIIKGSKERCRKGQH